MTAVYESPDLRFMYPENWEIADEDVVSWPRTVSVQSPGGGFVSIMMYTADVDPDELTQQVVSTMREEYTELEAAAHVERLGDLEAAGYEMRFYCFDLVVASRVLGLRAAARTWLIIWQAEDREFDRLEPVFRAITISLLQPPAEQPS